MRAHLALYNGEELVEVSQYEYHHPEPVIDTLRYVHAAFGLPIPLHDPTEVELKEFKENGTLPCNFR
jgi:hypothetical protein